jgi:response regulator of citrate/malate metabolism
MAPLPQNPLKVLLVEDHASLARLTADLIEELDCTLIGPARSIQDAIRLSHQDKADVALVDLSLPDGTGGELIHRLRDLGIRCAVLSAWCRDDVPTLVPDDVLWLEKPLTIEALESLIQEIRQAKADGD